MHVVQRESEGVIPKVYKWGSIPYLPYPKPVYTCRMNG